MAEGNLNAIRYRWWLEGRRDLLPAELLGAQNYARSEGDEATVADMEAWFAEYAESDRES